MIEMIGKTLKHLLAPKVEIEPLNHNSAWKMIYEYNKKIYTPGCFFKNKKVFFQYGQKPPPVPTPGFGEMVASHRLKLHKIAANRRKHCFFQDYDRKAPKNMLSCVFLALLYCLLGAWINTCWTWYFTTPDSGSAHVFAPSPREFQVPNMEVPNFNEWIQQTGNPSSKQQQFFSVSEVHSEKLT